MAKEYTARLDAAAPPAPSAPPAPPAPSTPPAPDAPGAAAPADAALDLRDPEREAELTRLFDAHHHQLVRLAALLGAGADAEDVVAEAFCDLHRRWNRLRDPSKAVPYLRAVVCNLVRMRQRHLAVVRRHPEPAPPDASSAEYEAVLREEHREVAQALLLLPDRQRQALVLRYWMDLGEREVADTMGISTGAVKSHTARGLAALARALEPRR